MQTVVRQKRAPWLEELIHEKVKRGAPVSIDFYGKVKDMSYAIIVGMDGGDLFGNYVDNLTELTNAYQRLKNEIMPIVYDMRDAGVEVKIDGEDLPDNSVPKQVHVALSKYFGM